MAISVGDTWHLSETMGDKGNRKYKDPIQGNIVFLSQQLTKLSTEFESFVG